MARKPAVPAPDGLTLGVMSPRYRTLTVGVLMSVGMVAVESLGVATALPTIAQELNGLNSYGWGLSALMLANIVSTVLAGRTADRRGPATPMALGMMVFAIGCTVAGFSWSWPLFLLGRILQGIGVGAVMSMAYTMIGLAYPSHLQARMFALLSSAWSIPSLAGPFVAGLLTDSIGWRWVFAAMLPVAAIAALLTLPGLQRLSPTPDPTAVDAPRSAPWRHGPLASSLQLTLGTALLLQALLLKSTILLIILSIAGIALAIPGLRRVTPPGTLTARTGIGTGVLVRGLLCGAYFGSEAFLPLGLQELRGQSTTAAGLGLSAGALVWVLGSFLQAKWDATPGSNRVRHITAGSLTLLVGMLGIAATILTTALPAWFAVIGWAVGGLGMGIAFNASTTETLGNTPNTQQGQVSGALQLAQTLATGLIAGIGGAAVNTAGDSSLQGALLGVFVLTAILATLPLILARRIRT